MGTEDANQVGRDVIVVIGIDDYAQWPILSNAKSDATGTLALFQRLGFVEVVPSLYDKQATGTAMARLVQDDLRSALRPQDRLVVFFAGHGHTTTTQIALATGSSTAPDTVLRGYLIPADGALDLGSTWMRVDNWLQDIAELPPKHILVILDACHSGIAVEDLIKYRDLVARKTDEYASLAERRSRRIITSALGNQSARDTGPVSGHSLFTGCLIEALTGRLAYGNDARTTGSELGFYLQRRVRQYTSSEQTPDFGSLELDHRGELVLPVLKELEPEPAPPFSPPLAPAIDHGHGADGPKPIAPYLKIAVAVVALAAVALTVHYLWRDKPPDDHYTPTDSHRPDSQPEQIASGPSIDAEQTVRGSGGVDPPPPPPPPRCGDRHVDHGEECDDGEHGSPSCTSSCRIIYSACYKVAGDVYFKHDGACPEVKPGDTDFTDIVAGARNKHHVCNKDKVFKCP